MQAAQVSQRPSPNKKPQQNLEVVVHGLIGELIAIHSIHSSVMVKEAMFG